MSDVFALLQEEVDASKFDTVDKEGASDLSNLIRRSIQIDKDIEEADKHLKDLKFKKRKINEEDIPNLMNEMGMDSVEVDGYKIKVRPFVHARISEEKREEAFAFLRSIGEADIIKNEVTVAFSAGQDNQAGAVIDDLRQQGYEPAHKTHVHPSTLKSWVRGRVEAGQDLDFDTFGVYVGNEAKITRS